MRRVVRFEYDRTNRTVIDPLGNITNQYDGAGRLIHQVDPLGQTNSFAYDAAGNRIEAVDRNGRRRTFEYDALNRRTREQWWEAGAVIRTIQFAFNAVGVMTNAFDPASSLAFEFDPSQPARTRDPDRVAGLPDFRSRTRLRRHDERGFDDGQPGRRSHIRIRHSATDAPGLAGGGLPERVCASRRRPPDQRVRFADAVGPRPPGSRYAYDEVAPSRTSGMPPHRRALAEYHYTAIRRCDHPAIDERPGRRLRLRPDGTVGECPMPEVSQRDYSYDANGNRTGGNYVVDRIESSPTARTLTPTTPKAA
jgi:YD repeat-containing protein